MSAAGGVRGYVGLLNIAERKMTMKAMRANMCKASPLVLAALSVAVAGCSGNNNGSASGGALTASTFSAPSAIQSSQTIIALDPVNQAIWVPSYTLDANGNLQYELISTAAAVAGGTATVSKKVSMVGCDTPIGITYASGSNASSGSLLVECGNSTTMNLFLSAVDAGSLAVTPIATPGLTWNGSYGGIIYDPQHNQAFVAGSQNFGLLQVPAGGAPSFEANSVTAMPVDSNTVASDNVISMAMNFTTQQVVIVDPVPLFISYSLPFPPYLVDVSTVNTAAPALNIMEMPGLQDASHNFSPYQGAAFDSATDVLAMSVDTGQGSLYSYDQVSVFNMATYNANGGGFLNLPTADAVMVNGFLDYYVGRFLDNTDILSSAGGLAALNATTHQVLVADTWGPNLLLIQMPAAPVPASTMGPGGPVGGLDNNGQPSTAGVLSLTPPDANSAYAIAQTLVSPQTTGTSAQFNVLGNPSALAIDQVNNIAYVLADNSLAPHAWTANTGVTLALVSVDLSAPVPGACPSPNGSICGSTWNPRTAQAVVP